MPQVYNPLSNSMDKIVYINGVKYVEFIGMFPISQFPAEVQNYPPNTTMISKTLVLPAENMPALTQFIETITANNV